MGLKMADKVSARGNPLGPIGTKVLFENEYIRAWSVELGPKGHQPLHDHDHPYLIVPLSEGKSFMRWEDGRERQLVDVLGEVVLLVDDRPGRVELADARDHLVGPVFGERRVQHQQNLVLVHVPELLLPMV